MSDILKQLPNKDVSTEAKELRAAFLHGATCLGKALNKSNGENGNVPLITRDDWLRLCCDWMGTQKCTIENLKLENVVNDALYTIHYTSCNYRQNYFYMFISLSMSSL